MIGPAEFLAQAWLALLVHLWQSTVVLGIIVLVTAWMRAAPAALLHRLWGLAWLKIVLPMAILGPITGWTVDSIRARFAGEAGATAFTLPLPLHLLLDPSESVAAGGVLARGTELGLPLLLTAAWLLMATVRARRLIHDVRLVNRRQGLPWTALSQVERVRTERAMHRTGLARSHLLFAADGSLPQTVGFLSPRIMIPRRLLGSLDESELRAVILHEDAHRRRRDPLRSLVRRAIGCILFFYPPLWLVERRLSEAIELVCDQCVSDHGVEREAFARGLAKTIQLGFSPRLSTLSAGVGGAASLRLRIQRISTPGRFTMHRSHRLVLWLVALLIVFTTFLPVPLRADRPESPPSTTAASDEAKARPEKEEQPELDKMPQIIDETLVKPEYPPQEKKAAIEGRVVLKVEVTENGLPGKIEAVEEVEDHPAFTKSSIAAVRQWRFEPGEINGEPVTCEVKIPIQFRLDSEKPQGSQQPEKS